MIIMITVTITTIIMTTTNEEYHVASFVAQAPPNHTSALSELINQFNGAEVHGCSEEGW